MSLLSLCKVTANFPHYLWLYVYSPHYQCARIMISILEKKLYCGVNIISKRNLQCMDLAVWNNRQFIMS